MVLKKAALEAAISSEDFVSPKASKTAVEESLPLTAKASWTQAQRFLSPLRECASCRFRSQ